MGERKERGVKKRGGGRRRKRREGERRRRKREEGKREMKSRKNKLVIRGHNTHKEFGPIENNERE